MIRLENLQKRYPEFNMHLDLSIEKGELVSILGPSGSGKTTTLRLLGGFETPDAGRVILGDTDMTRVRPARRNIGFVFQDYTLFPHMNVFENVAYGLRARRQDEATITAKVRELLSIMGLSGYEQRRVQTLSGGEKQRIAIARALAIDPVVLVLDEPFSSIDTPMRKGLRREIVRLQRELSITTLFVTHSQEEALSISDRVVLMREGRVVQFDTPRRLYECPANRFVASFVGVANFIRGRVTKVKDGALHLQSFRDFLVKLNAEDRRAGERDQQITVMIRPDRLTFRPSDEHNTFRATVRSKQYFAHYFEYVCERNGQTFSVFDSRDQALGEEVRIGFRPEEAYVLPSDAD